ncbi:MAG: nucleotide exchange factor GrpE [Victivallales bacterium]|jgi:molecular chaperone GrpE
MSHKKHNEKENHNLKDEGEKAPETPKPSLEDELKQRIAALELELAEAKDKILRAHADFDNFRKRTFKEMKDLRTMVKADTMVPILNVFDHFNMALDAAEKKPDFKVLHDGMKMIFAEFEKAMNELDIKTLEVAEGQEFDPNVHEAVSKEYSEKHEEGKILRQWKRGYKIGDRLLRPAVVVVSSGPQLSPAPSEAEKTTEDKENIQED